MKKGYTLIELLIVLSIIGITFGTGFISYRDFAQRQQIKNVSKAIVSDIRLAQGQAFAGKKPTGCDQTLDGYAVQFIDTNTYTISANCGIDVVTIKEVTLPEKLFITTLQTNPVLFKSVGQGTNIPEGQTVNFAITSEVNMALTTVVNISASGEVTSEFGNTQELINNNKNSNLLDQIQNPPITEVSSTNQTTNTTDCSFYNDSTCNLTPTNPCCTNKTPTSTPTATAVATVSPTNSPTKTPTPKPTTTPSPTPTCSFSFRGNCVF